MRSTTGFVALLALAMARLPRPRSYGETTAYGRHWIAITGKPLPASMMFERGGNAVDAACAWSRRRHMFDSFSWGGEVQALVFDPRSGKVTGVNALGAAPTGATPEFFLAKGMPFPPEFGPLAAVTPGAAGGLMVMLAEFGKLSLAEVLAPAIDMADGYPIEMEATAQIGARKADPVAVLEGTVAACG
jgi:gamma-glutamyltranspeptidase/glutathione hydrolase